MPRSTLSKILVGAGAAALLATAIHGVPASAAAPAVVNDSAVAHVRTAVPDAAADGKNLFRGVHFFQGDVGQALAAAKIFDTPQEFLEESRTPEALETVDTIIAAIEKSDGTFFAGLAKDLRSGDPYRVEKALTRASEQIEKHAQTRDDGTGDGTCAVVAVVVIGFGIAVYAVHSAVVLDVAVVARHIRIAGGGLTTEEFVAKLTPQLAQA
jgi:SdpC family antimicrobial peptide